MIIESRTGRYDEDLAREPTSLVEYRHGTIGERLHHVYRFAGKVIPYAPRLLDIGTYNGLGIKPLSNLCDELYSIEIDLDKLDEACENPEVTPLIEAGKVQLHHMDACDIRFDDNTFNAATIIEVFGAGFEGEETDIQNVFNGIHRVLTPGAPLLFTIKSSTNQRIFRPFEWAFPKGYPLHRKTISQITDGLFSPINWYGQLIMKETEAGILMPAHINGLNEGIEQLVWNKGAFEPKAIENDLVERPMYWIGVCNKLEEAI